MKISLEEQKAIREVLAHGAAHGYGNMIAHLQTAWAKTLMRDYGFSEEDARKGALGPGYPFAMQDDLVNKGEWDETGERYRATPPRR